jgi:hypothetical protein
MSRTLDSQLSFADLELSRLGVHLDPVLQGIDAFLGQHSDLVEQVRLDLERGLKNPTTGRSGITPSQTLRSLTLMRVKNWDYRELRERINDGYAWGSGTPLRPASTECKSSKLHPHSDPRGRSSALKPSKRHHSVT